MTRRYTLACACTLLHMFTPSARADPPPQDVAAGVRQTVLGIISYTRWPEKPAMQRLCIVGQPSHAGALLAGPIQLGGTELAVTRNALQGGDIGRNCDTVYAGTLGEDETTTLRRQIAGHPVLTIAEDDPSCSSLIMFCLDTNGTGPDVAFVVNLDSVARSGVMVNPRVLLLGRRKKHQP